MVNQECCGITLMISQIWSSQNYINCNFQDFLAFSDFFASILTNIFQIIAAEDWMHTNCLLPGIWKERQQTNAQMQSLPEVSDRQRCVFHGNKHTTLIQVQNTVLFLKDLKKKPLFFKPIILSNKKTSQFFK